jgi:phosphoglycolate phosphatase-like HAD superfamily hydrolase
MPGVRALLDDLSTRDDVCLALLTGNFEGGARTKLEYFDLWRYFGCGAYGEDGPDRNSLLAVALERAAACGVAAHPARTVVVGDTPHDIAVAAAGGARSVAVATGSYSVEELAEAGADVVLADFSDLQQTLRALGVA